MSYPPRKNDKNLPLKMPTAYQRNAQWAAPRKSYQTDLPPDREGQFQQWVAQNQIPFDPADPYSDYDMRGYWQQLEAGQAQATEINPYDGQQHYSDEWKTPFHQSFSAESRYAQPTAPVWANDYQLIDPASGRIIYDERVARQANQRFLEVPRKR